MRRLALPIRFLIAFLILSQLAAPTLIAPREFVLRGDYMAALRVRPDDVALLNHWAMALLKNGQSESAALILRRIAALQPIKQSSPGNTPETLRIALNETLRNRDWRTAKSLAEQLVTLQPQDASIIYTAAILAAPDDPEKAAGWLLRATGDPQWGIDARDANLALSRAPDRVSGLQLIGTQLIAKERWVLAEYILNRITGLDRARPETLALLALTQDSQGRDGSALITLALNQQPDSATVNYAAAVHWRHMGDLERALEALGRASVADPKNAAIPAEIATIYRQRNNPDEAARFYTLAVRLAPGEIGFYRVQTAFYADENFQLEGAGDQAIRQARALFPNDAELIAIYGQMRYRLGQFAEAKAALDRALELDTENLRARYYTGQLAQWQGDIPAARTAYERVIRIGSGNTFAALAERALADLPN